MGMLSRKLDVNKIEIFINKKPYVMEGNFRAYVEIENRACTGLGGLVTRIALRTTGVNDIVSIIYGGIIGGLRSNEDPPIRFEELGDLIVEEGIEKFIIPCGNFVTYAYTGEMPDEFEEPKKKA